jgi:hypothetical protein
MTNTNEFWGYHLILDCHACDVPSIQSHENVYNWIKKLVKDAFMPKRIRTNYLTRQA